MDSVGHVSQRTSSETHKSSHAPPVSGQEISQGSELWTILSFRHTQTHSEQAVCQGPESWRTQTHTHMLLTAHMERLAPKCVQAAGFIPRAEGEGQGAGGLKLETWGHHRMGPTIPQLPFTVP